MSNPNATPTLEASSHIFDERFFEKLILSIEKCIAKSYEASTTKNTEPLTLLSGFSGTALFYAYAYKKFKEPRFLDMSNNLIEACVDRIGEIEQPSLYQGFAGIAWTIRHLANEGIVDSASLSMLDEIDLHIDKTIDVFAAHEYYSLMYGLIGHGMYFAEAVRNQSLSSCGDVDPRQALQKIVRALSNSSHTTDKGITWIDNTSLDHHKNNKVIYNLGLPHGITGIASFLSDMIDLRIEKDLSTHLLEGSLKWLLSRKENFSNISYYPSLIVDDEPSRITRLCWAYGDLCSALAYLKGYKHLKDERWKNESLQTALMSINRNIENSLTHTRLTDNLINAGICKGTCGIILLYKKLNDYFHHDQVSERIEYWIGQTLAQRLREKEIGDFKSFLAYQDGSYYWGTDTGFIEGLSGIGLTFLYLLDERLKNWQRVLLV